MTGTNHGLTGAVIALLVREPLIAVPLSFASHFACDAIPHAGLGEGDELFDNKFNRTLIGDFIVAMSLMVVLGFFFPDKKFVIWACMVAAASPDLMWAYYRLYIEKLKKRKAKYDPLARFHTWIQWSQTPKGWIVEGVWGVLMSGIILTLG